MELLPPLNYTMKHRLGKASIISDALSRREQDIPKDAKDSRIALREQVLLPPKLWVNTATVTDLVCPFPDEAELKNLWKDALQPGEIKNNYLHVFDVERRGERQFPPEIYLRMATGKCDVSELGLLRYRERIWSPNYEPLNTAVIQKIHDSFLSGHPGRDATISLISRQIFWPGCNQDVRHFIKNCDTCGRSTIWRD